MVDLDACGLIGTLSANGLDAICLVHPANLRHQCGFTGTDGAFVVTEGQSWFLTDSRYTVQAEEQVANATVIEYRQKASGICKLLARQGVRRVGFEAAQMTVAELHLLERNSGGKIEWVPLEKQLLDLRSLKSDEEKSFLKRAADIAADAFSEILPLVRPGIREVDIAMELEFALRRRGGEEKAFDFIVASGTRGALPHGVASDKILASGELVTIDFGTRYRGYHSDETVTLALGDVDEKLREVFDTVLEAHDLALQMVRPGVSLNEIDEVARELIRKRGYGDYFGHGLGHGVGLEIHEYPVVSPRSEAHAQAGMVFTIEPGIYVPDLGGCRIEDMVMVTADGCEVLTSIPKQFQTIN